MKISLHEDGAVKILLAKQDLEMFDLSYKTLDENDSQTQIALKHWAEMVHEKTGFKLEPNSFVNAISIGDDFLLLLYESDKSFLNAPMKNDLVLCIFDEIDPLLNCLSHFGKKHKSVLSFSSIYQYASHFFLLIYNFAYDENNFNNIMSSADEFTDNLVETTFNSPLLASIYEHGVCLAHDTLDVAEKIKL